MWNYQVRLNWFTSLDLPKLTAITTGSFSFYKTTSLTLTGLIDLIQLIWSSSINYIYYRRVVILWNNWIEFDWFDWFDPIHSIFLNYLHLLQKGVHSEKQLNWVWLVWLISFNSFDLPRLTTITTCCYSFYETTSLSLTSLIDLLHFIWSSSINYLYSRYILILWHRNIECI